MTKFDFGDTVRVRDDAPERFMPGSFASICSVTHAKSPAHALTTDAQVGETVHLIEFADGSSIELSARWLVHMEQMTKLERAVLDKFAESPHPMISDIRKHIPHVQILEREMTGVGFYTKMASSLGPVSMREGRIEGVSAESPNLSAMLGFILWLDKDGTCTLEGFTAEDHWPENADEYTTRLD